MDSYPYSQSSSYLNLLHSQQPSVVHENFSYESYNSSSVNLGSSDFPPFSSQQTEAPTQPEVTPAGHRERKKWTPADEEVLISAWLNTSKDVVVANDQNARTFWKRVGEYYATSCHATEGEKREHLHCKQRWNVKDTKIGPCNVDALRLEILLKIDSFLCFEACLLKQAHPT
ncbi:hypothetical protein YC2023_053777 [Brassica napus]